MLYDPKWEAKTTEPWRDVLRRAADLIERNGHCKHALHRDGSFCIGGAILFAEGWRPEVTGISLTPAAKLAFEKIDAAHARGFVNFNNSEATTKEMVISSMRAVADA